MSKSIKLTSCEIGEIILGETVDITDPGYDRDVWCRMNDVKVVPGTYTCKKYTHTSRYTVDGKRISDTRVFISGIYLKDHRLKMEDFEEIGEIGVDAGLAGYFPCKKDYSEEEWSSFCDRIYKGNAWLIDDGFCTSSGYGDGCYPVYAIKDETGRATALEIRF